MIIEAPRKYLSLVLLILSFAIKTLNWNSELVMVSKDLKLWAFTQYFRVNVIARAESYESTQKNSVQSNHILNHNFELELKYYR